MSMSYGVNKKAPTIVPPPLLLLTMVSPGLFVLLQEYFINLFCSDLTDYCKK